ncbi:MAG: glutamate--tRNA ligase [Geminicoccaceae bacterium]|nr:glutamate--tRNA ligase [Geminicoccaceae bacterium]
MSVVVRFAPSPTGFLHIGSARTALFNWLFARHHGGRYLVRIEDTDRQRSTQAAVDAIFDGLSWLGLESDEPAIFQFARLDHHKAAVERLLAKGLAYRCYCTPAELEAMREEAKAAGRPTLYDGRWRDRDPSEAPPGIDPAIRFKAPTDRDTVVEDLIQGTVRIAGSQLDDMVLLRADGTPTYMLSVVVDDIDMGITHIIRGDDHLVNAARQQNLFEALGHSPPAFAHMPLIHGPDGAKLSKRHGALGVDAYRDMGYLPEAVCNYLLRLGWSHGDDEVIDRDQAIAWFDMDAVGRSPSRFDFAKLAHLNAHYMKAADPARLAGLAAPLLKDGGFAVDSTAMKRLVAGMPGLASRARTIVELADAARIYVESRPVPVEAKAARMIAGASQDLFTAIRERLEAVADWSEEALEHDLRGFAEEQGVGFGKVAQPLRAAITGRAASPSLFEVMHVLGKEEVSGRLMDAASGRNPAMQHED